MIFSLLLSVTVTFTATATGVEKGAMVEFILAGPNSDRAYESMFILDEPVDAFCKRIEAVVPKGTAVDPVHCRLWPTGCRVRFEPSFDVFVTETLPEGEKASFPVFTGGSRLTNDTLEAASIMPAAVFSTYSLPQSPIVFNNPVGQGAAYGRYTAAVQLEKGKHYTFKMIVDEGSLPQKLVLTAEKGNLQQILQRLRAASVSGEVDVQVSFSDSLTVEEAIVFAQALALVDSTRVKLNGSQGLFYQAFLPLEKWRDRQERLQQPFELAVHDDGTDQLVFIEEDWHVEGIDPKLTPRQITFEQAEDYSTVSTCFIYASKKLPLSRLTAAMKKLDSSKISNWYVFAKN